jgi:two-component system KDP operon response regulator KdpE
LVEDDPGSANALRLLLSYNGYEVILAPTLGESMRKIDPSIDAVILDLMLPDGNGDQLLAHIRKSKLPIRVLVTTAVSDGARIEQVKTLRPEGIFRKPIDLEELLRGLGKGSGSDPNMA